MQQTEDVIKRCNFKDAILKLRNSENETEKKCKFQ